MNFNLVLLFIVLTMLNVVAGTVKSIATIKGTKVVAAAVNAVAYGINTVAIIYTVCDLPMWIKVVVVAATNFIGVFTVKLIEERSRKERLWKLECTVPAENTTDLHAALDRRNISHTYIEGVGKYSIFNVYCATKDATRFTKKALEVFDAKYFVTESGPLG